MRTVCGARKHGPNGRIPFEAKAVPSKKGAPGMSDRYPHQRAGGAADSFARGVRTRIGALILASAVAVAIVFGCTFYFALLANESAVARQIPELGQVAAQMKNLLIMNTIVFVGIIIASFYALSFVVASRIFRPLGELHDALRAIAAGAPTAAAEHRPAGAFATLEEAFHAAADRMAANERAETAELSAIADELSGAPATAEAAAKLRSYIQRKTAPRTDADRHGAAPAPPDKDPLFIQPL
jgi:HAMP domain-containing protein